MKKFILVLFVLLFGVNLSYAFEPEAKILPSQIGLVKNVEFVEINTENSSEVKQVAEIKILTGELKGTVVSVDNMLSGNPFFDINLKKGARVILHVENEPDGWSFAVEDVKRSDLLIVLGALFCLFLLFVGRKKGLYSLISILLTCVLIAKFLSPMILAGVDCVLATMLICVISTAITMYLVGGFNRKSTSATIGCILSILFAGMLAYFTIKFAHMTGFSSEQTMYLFNIHPELNYVSLVVSTIILATLGAVMDVAMSIASTINEIYSVDSTKTVKELFVCGMNVGRDIIGTMANTLILVYLGSSLPLVMLASHLDLQKFINLSQVFSEIASALIGSSAIILCVPITALVASELVKNIPSKIDFSTLEE